MINHITLTSINAQGYIIPNTGKTVQVYAYHASDVAGSAPNGSLVGNATERGVSGKYEYTLGESQKLTVVVDGDCEAGMIGIMGNGETALDDSVDTSAIQDDAVTNDKIESHY